GGIERRREFDRRRGRIGRGLLGSFWKGGEFADGKDRLVDFGLGLGPNPFGKGGMRGGFASAEMDDDADQSPGDQRSGEAEQRERVVRVARRERADGLADVF